VQKQRARLAIFLTAPALICILLLVLYPLGYAILNSFKISDGSFGMESYLDILNDALFWEVFWNTVKFTIIIVGSEVILGLIVALSLQKMNRVIRNTLRAFFMIPLLVAPVVASYEWMWLFNDQYGLINFLLKAVGLNPPLWLAEPNWAFFSIVIVDMWIATPFVILILQSALSSLPAEPYESAKVEGASGFQLFIHLTLPYLKPALLVILIIRTMDVFRLYDAVAVLTNGGPGLATTTLSMLIFRTGMSYGELGKASAMSIVTIVPILLVSLFYIRLLWSKR
jgi:multiple sugar transport system permease protein